MSLLQAARKTETPKEILVRPAPATLRSGQNIRRCASKRSASARARYTAYGGNSNALPERQGRVSLEQRAGLVGQLSAARRTVRTSSATALIIAFTVLPATIEQEITSFKIHVFSCSERCRDLFSADGHVGWKKSVEKTCGDQKPLMPLSIAARKMLFTARYTTD